MKKLFLLCLILNYAVVLTAQDLKSIELPAPDKTRGLPVMEALSVRASVREWSEKPLSMQDLSEAVWAANGVNRPDGKRTASSAMNAQDVDVYVFMKEGVFIYNAAKHVLDPVAAGDYMDLPGKTDAPVNLVLISDVSRFRAGSDSLKLTWGYLDAGIVSQNISLYCAATGLKTRPRASFPDMAKMRQILKLKQSQHVMLNHPVGYPKK